MEKFYRLLIVDDEYHVVDWLAELFEEQEEFEFEIYKAYLGREALTILDHVKIDIILSDIKMPGMDGFTLADKITENWPQAKIIFLTGYNQFEYAYKATQYKNISFLLKTEDDDVILDEVRAAVEELEKEKKQFEMLSDYEGMKILMAWQKQKNQIVRWLERGSDIETDGGIWSDKKKTVVACIKIGYIENSVRDREELGAKVWQILGRMLQGKGMLSIIDLDPTYLMMIVQSEKDQGLMLYMKEMLEEFSYAILEVVKAHAFFTLYEEMVEFGEIESKYEILKLAMGNVAVIGALYGGRVIEKEEAERLQGEGIVAFSLKKYKDSLQKMSLYFQEGEETDFFNIFNTIAEDIVQVSSMHFFPAIEVYQELSIMFLSMIQRKKLTEKLAFKTALIRLMNVSDFKSWKDAFEYLEELAKLIFEEQREAQKGKNEDFFETIKDFIKRNLGNDLSLTYIAQNMHYNPAYISRMFRQLSGKKLSEYILDEKINYAKRRLVESDDAIARIAREIGFESPQYFSVVFKKNTGMTPGEYRHKG